LEVEDSFCEAFASYRIKSVEAGGGGGGGAIDMIEAFLVGIAPTKYLSDARLVGGTRKKAKVG
jgi:hypothetical protein